MFLSADSIRNLIDNMDMVDGHTEEQYNFIEGSTFDLTLRKVFTISGVKPPFLGKTERELPALNEIVPTDGKFHLMPGYYIIQSCETIKLPGWIIGVLFPRTSLFNAGCLLGASRISCGYNGAIRCGLYVFNPLGFSIDYGARFVSVGFCKMTEGRTDLYTGIWGGLKMTTDGKERAF